jgi:hypothetical protein
MIHAPDRYQVKVIKDTKGVITVRKNISKLACFIAVLTNGYSSYLGERSYLYAAL